MQSTCRRCGNTVGSSAAVGCVSTAFPAAVLSSALLYVAVRFIKHSIGQLVWWLGLAMCLTYFVGTIALTFLFWEGPRWLAMLRNRFRRCPHCGARDWERPRYGGFGV